MNGGKRSTLSAMMNQNDQVFDSFETSAWPDLHFHRYGYPGNSDVRDIRHKQERSETISEAPLHSTATPLRRLLTGSKPLESGYKVVEDCWDRA